MLNQLLADFADLVEADACVIFHIFESGTEAFLTVFIQQPKCCGAFALPYSLPGALCKVGMVCRTVRTMMNGWRLLHAAHFSCEFIGFLMVVTLQKQGP